MDQKDRGVNWRWPGVKIYEIEMKWSDIYYHYYYTRYDYFDMPEMFRH